MAEQADARDLKSRSTEVLYEFDSRYPHQAGIWQNPTVLARRNKVYKYYSLNITRRCLKIAKRLIGITITFHQYWDIAKR